MLLRNKNNRADYQRQSNVVTFFSLIGVIFFTSALCYVAFEQIKESGHEEPWLQAVYDVLFVYLGFVTVRATTTLLFSFADRFFKKELKPLVRYPLVSIILPCFNEEQVIEKAIKSLLNINYPNFDIMVVDDGSTDLTLLLAKAMELEKNVRVIYQKNAGKAAALNRGIYEAMGEYFFAIDADSLIDPDVFLHGVPYLESDPKIAAVAGNVIVGNSHNLLTSFQVLEYVAGLNFQKSAQSFLSIVMIVPGPVGLFRRSAVMKVGGYHSTTFAEDCDLTIRLLMEGFRTVYCREMKAVTEAPDNYVALLKQRYRWSRGTLQAVRANASWIFSPFKSVRNFMILLYFFGESTIIPCANFIFAFFTIGHAIYSGSILAIGPFFLQLTILDLILSAYIVLFENNRVSLVLLSLFNRASYGLSMEIIRFVSLLDELLGLPMNWNKLDRKGLTNTNPSIL